ncbi:MAG: hypothetical protein WCH65_09360, partial [bacterium]
QPFNLLTFQPFNFSTFQPFNLSTQYMSLKSTLEKSDNIQYELYLKGLTEDTVRKISLEQKEPEWMLHHRLKSLEIFKKYIK